MRIAISGIKKFGNSRASTLQLHIHCRTRKLVHQFGRHGLAAVHGKNEGVTIRRNGFARDRILHVGQHFRPQVRDDTAILQAGDEPVAQFGGQHVFHLSVERLDRVRGRGRGIVRRAAGHYRRAAPERGVNGAKAGDRLKAIDSILGRAGIPMVSEVQHTDTHRKSDAELVAEIDAKLKTVGMRLAELLGPKQIIDASYSVVDDGKSGLEDLL